MSKKLELHYPEIRVKLVGTDSNPHSVLARVRHALRINHVPEEEVEAFLLEAKSRDYDHLLTTAMRWVDTY